MNVEFGTSGYVGGANIPYNQTITTGLHNEYQSLEAGIAEPRFGFAWQPDKKTVVRGGIGNFFPACLLAARQPVSSPTLRVEVLAQRDFRRKWDCPTDTASSAYAALASYNIFTSQFAAGAIR